MGGEGADVVSEPFVDEAAVDQLWSRWPGTDSLGKIGVREFCRNLIVVYLIHAEQKKGPTMCVQTDSSGGVEAALPNGPVTTEDMGRASTAAWREALKPAGAPKPGTLFERHRRPFRIDAAGGVFVFDADNKIVAGSPKSADCLIALVDMLNADAPKPFVPGLYPIKADIPFLAPGAKWFESEDAMRGYQERNPSAQIGKRLSPEF